MTLTFRYWEVRGRGGPIRNLLRFVGVQYKDVIWQCSDAEKWFDKKDSMGFDFPNLPYLIDGDLKLTQVSF